MKILLTVLALVIILNSCKKDIECKTVSVYTINGCDNTITYSIRDKQLCGDALTAVRKQNGTYVDIHNGGTTCRITTEVEEK